MTDLTDYSEEIQAALERENDPTSHVEPEPDVFHPSQLAYCKRQCYLSKLGLTDNTEILGTFKTGTLIHEWIEDHVAPNLPDLEFEKPVHAEVGGITITGHADAVDPENSVVYDFKSRASWYRFDPPTPRHVNQLQLYMAATGMDYGRVVYVSKKDLEVRPWPEDSAFERDADRVDELFEKAREIRDHVEAEGPATSTSEIPFGKCGCFVCRNESLDDSLRGAGDE